MTGRGVFAVDRDVWDDPDFADEPFSEREAFLWLVGEAAWRPKRVRVGSAPVALDRGQCAFSTRFMAAKWKWSEARVRRYLTRLKNRSIIDAHADAHATHITICNYDRFQRVGLPSDAPSDAEPTQERRKEETRKHINKDSSPKTAEPVRGRATYPDDFEAFWSAYPTDRNMSKAEAHKVWQRLCLEDRKWAMDALPAFKQFCRSKPDYRTVYAERYLSQRRFEGHLPKPGLSGESVTPEQRVDFRNGYSAPLSTIRSVVERGRPWPSHWRGRPGEDDCVIPREFWSQILSKKAMAEQVPQGGLFH